MSKKCVNFWEIVWLIIMKMKMKIKYRSRRYDLIRSRSRDGHKYRKYRK